MDLFHFPSNSGHYSFRALARRRDADNDAVCVSLHYRASNRHIQGAMVPHSSRPIRWSISDFLTPKSAWQPLRMSLQKWLKDYQPFATSIINAQAEALEVRIGIRPVIICTADKPAVTIRYSTSRTVLECCYVVDETCIRIAADSLDWIGAGGECGR